MSQYNIWEALSGAKEVIVRIPKTEIEKRAFQLHQHGVNNDPVTDWIQSESKVMKSILCSWTSPKILSVKKWK
jgi:hypothetical protein